MVLLVQPPKFCLEYVADAPLSQEIISGNGIITRPSPRMTSEQSAQCEIQALYDSVLAQCLDGVLRTGGSKTTRGWRKGRYAELIEAHKEYKGKGGDTPNGGYQSQRESCRWHTR